MICYTRKVFSKTAKKLSSSVFDFNSVCLHTKWHRELDAYLFSLFKNCLPTYTYTEELNFFARKHGRTKSKILKKVIVYTVCKCLIGIIYDWNLGRPTKKQTEGKSKKKKLVRN